MRVRQDEREMLALARGPLMKQGVLTAAWTFDGWHAYCKGGCETAIPPNQRLQYRLSKCARGLGRPRWLRIPKQQVAAEALPLYRCCTAGRCHGLQTTDQACKSAMSFEHKRIRRGLTTQLNIILLLH